MGILIRKPGMLASFQDLGRNGFARFGINPGGVMDTAAARISNILCGNPDGEAVLEMHFPAPEIEFTEPVLFSLCGADFGGRLNDSEIEPWRLYAASAGDSLAFSRRVSGARAYLAVSGGFEIERWLGSGSTNIKAAIGGFRGRALIAGDRVGFGRTANRSPAPPLRASSRLLPIYRPIPTVRYVAGAEFELLPEESRRIFNERLFSISPRSDRMGFRLEGPTVALAEPFELVSSAVNFGTVQLLPDGQLIILMADHQTSGGYPRLANVIPTDLPLVAQLVAGDKIGFHSVSEDESERLYLEFEEDLSLLRAGCRFRLDAID
ncbi:MAG: biotin-dependent carboxyltransferase family protein [Acidobacteria bacterium]|nr:biotin-dependent carboxyltransferase family protein [Acidobacteriota bacterium]